MIGQTISHYKIFEKLGEGGMGVVYKAQDTRLQRTVALKFLADHLLTDPEAKKRLQREAQAAASLNHPRICTVYEIGEADGKTFIAMAFVEGVSLEKKIAAAPLAVKDAIGIARQVAEGIQAAHNKHIIHRDIKPANIMVGTAGDVTITDFGLARLAEFSRLTRAETTLGTVAYMSPEQTQGSDVDHRTDIWSLGAVLYEMVSGEQPFNGHYEQAQIYSILNESPEPLTARRKGVPMQLEWVVDKAMAKEPSRRYQVVGDLAIDLEAIQRQFTATQTVRPFGLKASPGLRRATIYGPQRALLALLAAGLALAVCVIILMWLSWPQHQPSAPVRLSINPGTEVAGATISPNGRSVAYTAPDGKGSIWVRGLDAEVPRQLAQTSGARFPFWHPESDLIAFASGDKLLRVSSKGANPVFVSRLPGQTPLETAWRPGACSGGTWSGDGKSVLIAVVGEGAYRIPAQGGTPELIIEDRHIESMSFLPATNGEQVLLYAHGVSDDSEVHEIVVHSLTTGRRTVVATVDFPTPEPAYSPTGHILYRTAGTDLPYLVAAPFSLENRALTGDPVVLVRGGEEPRVSRNGTLVYLTPRISHHQLAWLNRSGRKLGDVGEPHSLLQRQNSRAESIRFPSLSPDGRLVAVTLTSEVGPAIWLQEVERPVRTRLTLDSENAVFATWSPAGNPLTFSSRRHEQWDILSKPAEGGAVESIVTSELDEGDPDWSDDGRYMVFVRVDPENGRDIWYLEQKDGTYEQKPFLRTSFNEGVPKLSSDGRFVAYTSDESGRPEVYVRSFPQGSGRRQVSVGGGGQPRWRADNRELFYVQGDTLIAAEVTTRPAFALVSQTELFRSQGLLSADAPQYDVSPDGERFILPEPVGQNQQRTITVVLNGFASLGDVR